MMTWPTAGTAPAKFIIRDKAAVEIMAWNSDQDTEITSSGVDILSLIPFFSLKAPVSEFERQLHFLLCKIKDLGSTISE